MNYGLIIDYDQSLLKLHDYSDGTISYADTQVVDQYDQNTEKRYVDYYMTTNCSDSEGTIAEMRFNCPFETENCISSLMTYDEYIQMWNMEPYPDTSIMKVLMGDVNQDNVIDSADPLLVLQAAVNLVTLTEEQKVAADVNEDGEVTAEDSQIIQQYQVKLINSFWD